MMDPKKGIFFFFLWFQVMMATLFACIYVGMPIWITVVVVLGIVYALIKACIYRATITIDEHIITISLVPYMRYSLLKPQNYTYQWSDIKWYKLDKDWSRYGGEIEVLKIKFKDRMSVKITTNSHAETVGDFSDFKNIFIKITAKEVYAVSQDISKSLPVNHELYKTMVKRKPGFYSTPIAKVISIFFLFVSIILAYLLFTMQHSMTSIIKYLVVILPGTIYMLYRSFFNNS